jgi:hypothetical protein
MLAGNGGEARKWFDAFFRLWNHADPGLPVVSQARTEYARLR